MTAAQLLKDAADLVEAAWWKGGDAKRPTGAVCVIEALAKANCFFTFGPFTEARLALERAVGQPLLTWNYQAENGGQVARVMRNVAAELENG